MVLGDELVQAVLKDYRTADIDEGLRAVLALLEKLSLHPSEVTGDELKAPESLGVSRQAILDAVHVCILFNIIVRIADALNFEVPTDGSFKKMAKTLLKKGYKM